MSGFDFMRRLEPFFFRKIPEHRGADGNKSAENHPEIVRRADDSAGDVVDGEKSEENLHHRRDKKNDREDFDDFVLLVTEKRVVRVAQFVERFLVTRDESAHLGVFFLNQSRFVFVAVAEKGNGGDTIGGENVFVKFGRVLKGQKLAGQFRKLAHHFALLAGEHFLFDIDEHVARDRELVVKREINLAHHPIKERAGVDDFRLTSFEDFRNFEHFRKLVQSVDRVVARRNDEIFTDKKIDFLDFFAVRVFPRRKMDDEVDIVWIPFDQRVGSGEEKFLSDRRLDFVFADNRAHVVRRRMFDVDPGDVFVSMGVCHKNDSITFPTCAIIAERGHFCDNHLMQEEEKNNPRGQRSVLLIVAVIVAFVVGFYSARYSQSVSTPATELSNATTGAPANVDFSPFWKAWGILDDNFVSATTTASSTQARVYGAIQGMTAALGDPYTVFFPPTENQDFNDEITGSFGGVGMEMGLQNGQIVVIAPLKGTPADQAGVKAGDILTKVNDTDVSTLTLDQAVDMIRGDAGTTVSITVLRNGVAAPLTFKLTRTTIAVPTIDTSDSPQSISSTEGTSTLATLFADHIYTISLYTFTSDAADLFRGALKDFVASGDHKLIIDLRGNPGGYLEAAVDMASWFLPSSDVVVTEEYANGQKNIYESKGYDVFDNGNTDIAILVDGGSASASEIFSAALHDHDKAILVGEKTFGKGSVQELFSVTPDTSIKVTIAKWLTPDGAWISEKGIMPDYVVSASSTPVVKGVSDPQMAKAIQLLSAEN